MTVTLCAEPELREAHLFAYLAGTLPGEPMAEFDRHVLDCDACTASIAADLELEVALQQAAIPLRHDPKDLLRTAVREYLAAAQPKKLEEFDLVYDDVYETIERKWGAEQEEPQQVGALVGAPFSTSKMGNAPVASACWTGAALLEAALRRAVGVDLAAALDRVEQHLVGQGDEQDLLHGLRRHVEQTLAQL